MFLFHLASSPAFVEHRYSKDMLSGAFVLCNVADEERLSKQTHKALMMTADGFKWPVPKGPGEYTRPNHEVDAGRKDELGQPWVGTASSCVGWS
jgi:hypothetical protein